MSSYVRSAALNLLSRTLRSFLYKYLSDVDVEGVALPSLYDSDGQSGWGVRLCNVKLREGAELMKLPGKPKKRKRKDHVENQEEEKKQRNASERGETAMNGEVAQTAEKTSEEVARSDGAATNDPPAEEEHGERQTLDTLDTEDNSDCESIASSASSCQPPTTYSYGIPCLSFGSSRKPSIAKRDRAKSKQKTEENGERESFLSESTSFHSIEDSESVPKEYSTAEQENVPQADEKRDEETSDEIGDEDDYFEDPMILRLGEGGRIGTLDVRLVGKELHVLVEDAFLTVEAVPKSTNTSDSEQGKDAKSKGTETADKKPDKKPDKKAAPSKQPKTPGERILAQNAIAKLLSGLPHLFLRDIRVRMVIQNDNGGDGESMCGDDRRNPEESVVEFGVEFLSITSGGDFLSRFRMEDESASAVDNEGDSTRSAATSVAGGAETVDQNEYLIKRIRTGRGPSGGIWLKLYPPESRLNDMVSVSKRNDREWARALWMARTEQAFFRFSGLDIRARIFMGTKKELGMLNSQYTWFGEEYDEFTMDSMLYGVDYVGTGPQPPLPPITRHASTASAGSGLLGNCPEALQYQTDKNDIQSSRLNSNFHRVARGMTPIVCDNDHLPCENCVSCWHHQSPAACSHHLDSTTPLPGLVLNISLTDPLELNVDRHGLKVLGLVVDLFSSGNKENKEPDPVNEETENEGAEQDEATLDESQRSYFSFSFRKSNDEEAESLRNDRSRTGFPGFLTMGRTRTSENFDAFPTYMKPECIQIMGLHMSEVKLRVHVMRSDGRDDSGLSFRYWDMNILCLTADVQMLSAPEKSFQDVRLDLGHLELSECRGVEQNPLVSMGFRHPERTDTDSTSCPSTHVSVFFQDRPPWPSSAAALLDIPAPLETNIYESRERHAAQLRYVTVATPGNDPLTVRRMANVRIGTTTMDTPYGILSEISTVTSNAKEILFAPEEKKPATADDGDDDKTESSDTPATTSATKYKIQIDGGNIRLFPRIDVHLPLSQFQGELTTENGFSLKTLLQRIELSYGKTAAPNAASVGGLSLSQLSELPETVRLRILLFIKDLQPLEKGLGVKRESNSFLRCRAVNKGLLKMAKKVNRSSKSLRSSKAKMVPSRKRQDVLNEILKLDDASLVKLWSMHQRNKRKLARRQES